jgi:hypothetical protein
MEKGKHPIGTDLQSAELREIAMTPGIFQLVEATTNASSAPLDEATTPDSCEVCGRTALGINCLDKLEVFGRLPI